MRVLLLDEGFMSGTLTARGLQRAGCVVDVIAATGGRGACAGARGQWRLAPRVGDARLLDIIDAAARRQAYDVVYPVTEPMQSLVWDARPAWEHLVFPVVDERQRAARRDKRRMSELVAAHGVAIPRQLPASTGDEVRAAARELGLPLVVKGARGRGGKATRICRSLAEAVTAARALAAHGSEPFAQEYVPGVTHLVGGVFERGRPLRLYAGAKAAQFPARVGPAAELRSVHDAALLDSALRAFFAAEVSGLASMDLVREPSGDVRFLELNPRPWGSIGAAREAGVDLFGALVALWRSEGVEAQLAWDDVVSSPIFPLYLFTGSCWRSGQAVRALRPDARRAMQLVRDDGALALHLLHRLVRVGLNW